MLGAWALMEVEPYVATVKAAQPVHALRIDRESFSDLIEDNPEITHGILSSLMTKVRSMLEPLEQSLSEQPPQG